MIICIINQEIMYEPFSPVHACYNFFPTWLVDAPCRLHVDLKVCWIFSIFIKSYKKYHLSIYKTKSVEKYFLLVTGLSKSSHVNKAWA